MIYYKCSDGLYVSQSAIDKRRSDTYKKLYAGEPHPWCAGCGGRAQGTAHIISQQKCKHLHHTEWIWAAWNMFPACHKCNSAWESNDRTLNNYDECMQILFKYHLEDYNRRL